MVYYRSGYGTFQVDITDFVKFGNEENVVAVQVAFKHQDSWWYTGAGILRDVWLTTTGPVHVNYNGTYIYTDGIRNATIETEIANTSVEDKTVTVKQTVLDKATGEAVAETSLSDVAAQADAVTTIVQELTVENAKLWGIDSPNLYTMKTEILEGEQVLDTYTTTFGFRTIEMDANEGFSLNGEYMKLHGVCIHADLGALGGAMSYAGMKARLVKLKEMGVNAIRTAHNICDPIWVELCDELGLFLYNEGLVSWNGNSYCMVKATDYEYVSISPKLSDEPTWGEIDMRNFTRRDRNHPCVILWGIGNEVTDTTYDNSVELVQGIIPWVKTEDPQGNGLVTQGLNTVTNANTLRVSEQLDVVGYNYSMARFGIHHTNYPDHIIFGSETTSAISSRGIYHTPADERTYQHVDMQVSSYDNCWVNWGNNAEDAWKYERDKKYVMGQFIWTGYDYIGEPTPYSKSDVKNSYFGVIDTAGLEKDSFYFWQSVWTEEPMVHLLPYWDSGMGDVITVFAYSNAYSVELFVNGESQGKQTIDLTTADEPHYSWDIPYVDGEAIAKAYDAFGTVVATDRIATFGESAKVHLEADRQEMTADGRDLIYVTASILDEKGEFVATARSEVKFTVSGAGKLVGVDNGDSTDVDEYYATERNAFSGKVVAIICSDGTEGPITVTAESRGLTTGTIELMARHDNPVTEITLRGIDGQDTITEPGGSLKMVAAVNADADFEKVAYTVTDEKGDPTDRATIDSAGVLTAWKNGTVVVHAASLDGSGMTDEQTVTISGQNEAVTAQTITVTASSDVITEKSGRIRFTAEVAPAGAEQAVRWTLVSGQGLLRQDGELVALYDGAVTVRAEALDGSGVTAEKTVEISGQSNTVIPANKLLVQTQDGSDPILNADKPYVLVEAVLLPEGSVSDVEWNVTKADGSTVDETAIIDNVDANGVATVVAQGDGEFYVTASAKNESRFPQVFGMLKFTAEDLGVTTRDPYQFIEAVTCDKTTARLESTSAGEQCLGGIGKNTYCVFRNLNFGVFGSKTFLLSGAADKNISTLEIRKDSPDGELLTTIEFEPTGQWHNFTAREYTLEGLTGVQDICIVYKSSYGMCIYGIQFTEKDHSGVETKDPYTETVLASADELSATTAAWTYLDFGEDGSKSVTLTGKCAQDAVVELRDGSPEGRLLGKMTFTASETEMTQSFRIPTLTGIKNLCFVFPEDFSFTSFVFRPAIRPAFQIIQAERYDSSNNTSGSLAEELHTDGEASLQAMRTGLNDTLEYHSLDFGINGSNQLLVYGKVDADAGSKQLMVLVDGEQLIPNTAMNREDGFVVYEFDAAGVTGVHDLQFSFIQGEDFLFDWFTFVEGNDILYRENIFLNKLTTAHNESSARGAAQNAVSADSKSWSAGCGRGRCMAADGSWLRV